MLCNIVFIHNKNTLWGKLTKFFTGSYIYHVGFLTEDEATMYDMSLLRREVSWKGHEDPSSYFVIPCPVVITELDLLHSIAKSNSQASKRSPFYGILDYMAFALKPLYHFFGQSTPNLSGTICSEWVNDELVAAKYQSIFKEDVPSPTDLYLMITNEYLAYGFMTEKEGSELDALIGLEKDFRRLFR